MFFCIVLLYIVEGVYRNICYVVLKVRKIFVNFKFWCLNVVIFRDKFYIRVVRYNKRVKFCIYNCYCF